MDQEIKRVADRIYASDQQKFIRLIVWIKQAQKYHYSNEVITQALIDFEPYAGSVNKGWYQYLDKIIDKVSADCAKRQSDMEHESRKQHERELVGSLKLARVVKDA